MSRLKQSRYRWIVRTRKIRLQRLVLGSGETSLSGFYSPKLPPGVTVK